MFVVMVVLSVVAYRVGDLGKLQDMITAGESPAVLQGITAPDQIDEALRQHPQDRLLRILAMATRAADEANAAIEKLSGEVEPPGIPGDINLAAASREDLETLRRNLKLAQANAAAFMPRYLAVLKTERDHVESEARGLRLEKDTVARLLAMLDKRQAEIRDFSSRMLSARAEFYRAYESYVGVLVAEFGAYKVENGQFIFPFQRTVDRYNIAARAMSVATKRVAELEQERKGLLASQQEGWKQFVSGK
jgi:hypothetical protein